jgi:hypothetical protein
MASDKSFNTKYHLLGLATISIQMSQASRFEKEIASRSYMVWMTVYGNKIVMLLGETLLTIDLVTFKKTSVLTGRNSQCIYESGTLTYSE